MKALRKILVCISTTTVFAVVVPAMPIASASMPTVSASTSTEAALTATDSGSTSRTSSCTGWVFRDPEKQFASKINESRLAFGKSKLHLDRELSKAARRHSREMMQKETLYHTPSPTLKNRVTNWIWLGENVGVGSTVDSLHVAFMHSPEHKENILFSKYRHVGVGTRQRNGRLWVTVIFEAETNPGTTLPMPRC